MDKKPPLYWLGVTAIAAVLMRHQSLMTVVAVLFLLIGVTLFAATAWYAWKDRSLRDSGGLLLITAGIAALGASVLIW